VAQWKYIAFANVIANLVLRIDAVQTDAGIALNDVKRCAFASLLREFCHQRKDDVADAQTALIQCSEQEWRRTDLITPVIQTLQILMLQQ